MLGMKRIHLDVWVDLDPVPGAMHTVDDALAAVLGILHQQIPHYHPLVSSREYMKPEGDHVDWAIEISVESMRALRDVKYTDTVAIGWYVVISSDPNKHQLLLPPHIFKKCFMFTEPVRPGEFALVKETV